MKFFILTLAALTLGYAAPIFATDHDMDDDKCESDALHASNTITDNSVMDSAHKDLKKPCKIREHARQYVIPIQTVHRNPNIPTGNEASTAPLSGNPMGAGR